MLPEIENGALYYPLGFAIVVLLVLGGFMRSSSKGPRLVREGRVTGIIGRKGHGKTLFLTHELLRSLGVKQRCRKCSQEAGKSVFHRVSIATNGSLSVPAKHEHLVHRIGGWEDVIERVGPNDYHFQLPHMCLVAVDEAHLFAPAKQGEQLPEAVRWYLSQCRKGCQEFVWISQNASRVSLGLRVQTDEIGVCRRGWFKGMSVRFHDVEDINTNGSGPRQGVKALWTFRYRVTRKLAKSYNTYELLQPDSGAFDDVASGRVAGGAANRAGARAPSGAGLGPLPAPASPSGPSSSATIQSENAA